MKIAESAISLYSERTAIETHHKRESLTVWQGQEDPSVRQAGRGRGRTINPHQELAALQRRDKVRIAHQHGVRRRQIDPAEVKEITDEKEMETDLNMRLLRELFERLTGRKFRMIDPLKLQDQEAVVVDAPASQPVVEGDGQPPEEGAGFGLVYDYHESHYEYEKTEFQAGGVITTSDGKEIDFSLSLSMSREFYTEQNMHLRAGDALKDPLVINFSGTAAQLTAREFAFDIDGDGHKDQIAFVKEGSGFLALDRSGDGVINDGSELFGALSGDGFAELARYDTDGNNWIDENDSIYDQLRIWSKSADGEDRLVALGQAGVGAIYLDSVETLFAVKDQENSMLGQVRSTGLAVMESGMTTTVQQLDLVA